MRHFLALLSVVTVAFPGIAGADFTVYPPSITLIAPQGGRYVAPAAPVFYATASPSYGDPTIVPPTSILRIEFLDGDTVIGTVPTPNSVAANGLPAYTFVWNNPPLGPHLINARVVDTAGYTAVQKDNTTGAQIQVPIWIVAATSPAQVSLVAPSTGQTFTWAGNVPLVATVSNAQAPIRRIEFVVGNTVVAVANSPPYGAQWVNPPPGDFALVAKVYDENGIIAASPAAYIRVLASRPPAVVLTAPSPGTLVPGGAQLAFSADAVSPDGSIGRVDFYAGTSLVGGASTSPYSYIWSNPSPGPLSLTAKAFDLRGASSTSAPVSVTVGGAAPPVVTLTAPATGATFVAPATIGFSATASEPGGTISKVEFLSSGSVVATATSSPYNATWSGVGAGSYVLIARATDIRGATAYSGAVAVTVNSNHAPTVSLTAPTNGQSYVAGQPIPLAATATDADGTVTKVEFLADGSVIGTATAAPYTMSWIGAGVGAHSLTARATDNAGAVTTSAAINITVTPHGPPTITLTQPRGGQTFSVGTPIVMAASAAASQGTVVRVEFSADGTLIATVPSTPYIATWSGAQAGVHVLTAKVVDDQGAVVSSPGITIQVVVPTLTISTPAPGASTAADFVLVSGTYQGPSNSGVTVNGLVARNDGQGHFFVNNLPLVNGANTLTVILTTQDGQTTTLTRTVTSTGTAPMQIYADPDADFAPAAFTIRVSGRTGNPITNVSYLNLGGGQLDSAIVDQTTLGKINYASPGIYMPSFVITDSAGNTYTQSLAIMVRDKAVLDQMLKTMWADFGGALAIGDVASATKFLSGNAQVRYGSALVQIAPSLPTAIASWEAPQTGALGNQISEYTVRRMVRGTKHVYFIYFLRDPNGIWQLDLM